MPQNARSRPMTSPDPTARKFAKTFWLPAAAAADVPAGAVLVTEAELNELPAL
jgi:hypothetical protein